MATKKLASSEVCHTIIIIIPSPHFRHLIPSSSSLSKYELSLTFLTGRRVAPATSEKGSPASAVVDRISKGRNLHTSLFGPLPRTPDSNDR